MLQDITVNPCFKFDQTQIISSITKSLSHGLRGQSEDVFLARKVKLAILWQEILPLITSERIEIELNFFLSEKY